MRTRRKKASRKIYLSNIYYMQNISLQKSFDYKNAELLKKFLNPHGRILARSRSGLSAKAQRSLAQAVKRARFLGFLPFIAK